MNNIIEKLHDNEYINDIDDAFDRIGLLTEMLKIAIDALGNITSFTGMTQEIAKDAIWEIEKLMENDNE